MDFIEKVEKLPKDIKEYFISNEPRLALEKSCFVFHIPEESIKNISSPIGLIFIGDIKLENLPRTIWENLHLEKPTVYGLAWEINKRIFNRFPEYFKDSEALLQKWSQMKSAPVISEDEAWKKVLEIEPWILEEEKSSQNTSSGKIQERKAASEKLGLIDAMKKYPDLGEQIITSQQIRIKNFNDPIRPSIKNWLSDYTARLGYESHDSIERGNYLFQSENTKNLGYEDRQRLSQILKSFDEKTPLTVDLNTKQVVFSAYALEKKQETQVIADYPPVSPTSRFSAADKFPVSDSQTNSKIDIEEGSKPAPAERPTGSTQEIKPENDFHFRKETPLKQPNPKPQAFPPAYQPKTKEPGDDFEKVIGFGEKKEEDHPISSSPRIVNLKEEKKEKPQPAPPAPRPKNLLNIKELVEQSRKENAIASPKLSNPAKSDLEIGPEKIIQSPFISPAPNQKPKEAIQKFGVKIGSTQRENKSLSPENNFVSHSYSQNIKNPPAESFRESLDETEKKLFQTNNQPDQERKGGPIKNDYSVATDTSGSNIQFSSPQKLSFEKEREKMEEQETKPAQPEIPQKPKAEPYRIFPSTME